MNERTFAAQLAEDLGPDDVRLVLGVFEADVSRLCGLIATAAGTDDPVGFRRAAHGLAGAAGAVGALALEQACRRGMALPADADSTALATAASDIRITAAQALDQLAGFIRTLGAAD
jgi:hypothetical protein